MLELVPPVAGGGFVAGADGAGVAGGVDPAGGWGEAAGAGLCPLADGSGAGVAHGRVGVDTRAIAGTLGSAPLEAGDGVPFAAGWAAGWAAGCAGPPETVPEPPAVPPDVPEPLEPPGEAETPGELGPPDTREPEAFGVTGWHPGLRAEPGAAE